MTPNELKMVAELMNEKAEVLEYMLELLAAEGEKAKAKSNPLFDMFERELFKLKERSVEAATAPDIGARAARLALFDCMSTLEQCAKHSYSRGDIDSAADACKARGHIALQVLAVGTAGL